MAPYMTPTVGRLHWLVQKNRHLIDSFLLRRAPAFVYRAGQRALGAEIPVFTFHAALPDLFEEQCRFLSQNGYRTLSGSEFQRCLSGDEAFTNAVVLTFDDGLKQVWSVAHPILQKYGLRAICFLVPGCIPAEDGSVRPTMADVWTGTATEADVVGIRNGEAPLASWAEIQQMHEAGTFEFHSHTMHHSLVPVSDRVFAFAGPRYDPHFFGNVHVPLYTHDGRDVYSREPLPGLPIFYARPRMHAERRFIPEEELLARCVDVVAAEGTEEFFQRAGWRRVLLAKIAEFRRERGRIGRFETIAERDLAVRQELEASKRTIEMRLPGARVDQLCYPWYAGLPFATAAARDVGFEMCYFGQLPGRPTNRPGQDPYTVVRVDELYVERLPGTGRMSLRALVQRLFDLRSVPSRLFPDRFLTVATGARV
jgi:hypothetical protein